MQNGLEGLSLLSQVRWIVVVKSCVEMRSWGSVVKIRRRGGRFEKIARRDRIVMNWNVVRVENGSRLPDAESREGSLRIAFDT